MPLLPYDETIAAFVLFARVYTLSALTGVDSCWLALVEWSDTNETSSAEPHAGFRYVEFNAKTLL